MTTTFKKTLLATALFAVAGYANAAAIRSVQAELITPIAAATTEAGSLEGLKAQETIVFGTDVDVLLKPTSTNVEQDVLIMTIAGAKFDTTVNPTLAGAAGSAYAGQSYEFFDFQGEDTIRFRVRNGGVAVTALAADHFELVATVDVSGVTDASKITLTSKVTSLNPVIGDYDKASLDLIEVDAQTSLTATTKFDDIIATADARKIFTAATGPTATAVLTLVNTAGIAALPITATESAKAIHTVAGNWGFVRDADKEEFGGNANGSVSTGEIDSIVVATSADDTYTYALSADNKLTVTQTAVGALDTVVTLTVTPAAQTTPAEADAATALSKTTFTVDTAITTTDSSFTAASGAAAGSFDVDGSVVNVPYLVLQDGRFNNVVTVTNTGSGTGEILVDIVDEAGVPIASGVSAGTSTPGSQVNLAAAIRTAVAAKKNLANVTKFAVTITTNVPADDIAVYSAYTDVNNGGERAIVNNDSKVQTK